MTDFCALLRSLRRPRLLIQAARCGLPEYRRERDLRRIAGLTVMLSPEKALPKLLSEEEALEQTRQTGDAAYSLSRHIEVLIALMAETRLLAEPAHA